MARIKVIVRLAMLGGAFLGVFLLLAPAMSAANLVNINTATAAELDTLPGIGPSLAGKIVTYRETNGPFQTLEEIMNVSGIGQSTFDEIKNLITLEDQAGNQPAPASDYAQYNIYINELLPNPVGSDEAEWIELVNAGDQAVDLAGWKIKDASAKSYTIEAADFDAILIGPAGFLIIERSVSGLTLNNDGDLISLLGPDSSVIHETQYTGSAAEGVAWARAETGEFFWTITLTKAAKNVITAPSAATAGGGQSADAADSLYYGKVFFSELMVDPPGIDNGQTEWIEIENASSGTVCLTGWIIVDNNGEHKLGEIYLPAGGFAVLNKKDTGITLNNAGGGELRLIENKGWQIDEVKIPKKTIEGESYNWCAEQGDWLWLGTTPGRKNSCPPLNQKPFAYFESSADELEVGDYLQLSAEESYDEDGRIVKYTWKFDRPVSAFGQIGLSWTFIEPDFEVKLVEPGKLKIKLTVEDELGGTDEYASVVAVTGQENVPAAEKEKPGVGKQGAGVKSQAKGNNSSGLVGLGKIENLSKGARIIVRGQVVVEPGALNKNSFYINDENGGVQIYMFSKDFPALALGDEVRVSGEISEAYGEKRVKVQRRENIEVLGQGDAFEPMRLDAEDVGEEYEGVLARLQGQITQIGTSDFWLDDMTAEVKVYIKRGTGIEMSTFDEGESVQVTGIISQYNEEYRVLPRYKGDIVVLGQVKGAESESKTQLTENRKGDWVKYAVAVLAAAGIIAGSLLLKKKRLV